MCKEDCTLVARWKSDVDYDTIDYAFTYVDYFHHVPSDQIYAEVTEYAINGVVCEQSFKAVKNDDGSIMNLQALLQLRKTCNDIEFF